MFYFNNKETFSFSIKGNIPSSFSDFSFSIKGNIPSSFSDKFIEFLMNEK